MEYTYMYVYIHVNGGVVSIKTCWLVMVIHD